MAPAFSPAGFEGAGSRAGAGLTCALGGAALADWALATTGFVVATGRAGALTGLAGTGLAGGATGLRETLRVSAFAGCGRAAGLSLRTSGLAGGFPLPLAAEADFAFVFGSVFRAF